MTAAVGPETENLTVTDMSEMEIDKKIITTYKTPLQNSRQ
jgi:hypothetical protein